MIIIDFAVLMYIAVAKFPDNIHLLFRILIGIAFWIILTLVYNIPYFGKFLSVAVGVFYAYIIFDYPIPDLFADGSTIANKINDKIWMWAARILVYLIFMTLHYNSVEKAIKYFRTEEESETDEEVPYTESKAEKQKPKGVPVCDAETGELLGYSTGNLFKPVK
jgi:hypothetical protein